jgi:hypothetical protein
MSKLVAHDIDDPRAMDGIADLLSSPHELVRCRGRLACSRVGEAMAEFVRAEVARGTDQLTILAVAMEAGLQHVASIGGQLLAPGADEELVAHLVELTEEKLPKYLSAVRSRRTGGAA